MGYGLPARKPIQNTTGSTITLRDTVYGGYQIEPGCTTIPRDLYQRNWRKLQGKVVDLESAPAVETTVEQDTPPPFGVCPECGTALVAVGPEENQVIGCPAEGCPYVMPVEAATEAKAVETESAEQTSTEAAVEETSDSETPEQSVKTEATEEEQKPARKRVEKNDE